MGGKLGANDIQMQALPRHLHLEFAELSLEMRKFIRRALAAIDDPFGQHPGPFRFGTLAGRILRAVDGDTYVVMLNRGFGDTSIRTIRLNDIDTWERWSGTLENRAKGLRAWEDAVRWTTHRWCEVSGVLPDPDDKYGGRWNGHIDYHNGVTWVDLTVQLDAAGHRKTI